MPYSQKSKHKKIHSKEWDECVGKVKRKNTAVNPYAVCTHSLGKKSFRKHKKSGIHSPYGSDYETD